MLPPLIVLLAATLSFVFGWNNGSYLIGNLRGSGTLSVAAAVLVSGAGLLLGALAEGPKMTSSLVGSLAASSNPTVILASLWTPLILLFVLSVLGRPMSLSMTLVGAFLGATYAGGIAINASRTLLVIGFWFLAPIATATLTFLVYTFVRPATFGLSLARVDLLNRVTIALSAILVSYTLGANNIGLLQSTVIAGDSTASKDLVSLSAVAVGIALLAFLGAAMFGRGAVAGTIGDRMLDLPPQGVTTLFVSSAIVVWVGTQFALPISIAQCVLGGMFGASLAKRIAVMNGRLAYETVLSWLVVPTLAFVLSWAAMRV
ncbi:MAG TPA: inorganic phosphate transporter [Nitrososphaerales archaeon]|nr:inorganic phosphate transporter [Nitrososphaerales archaeon]